jgi:hypothetical protein
VNLPAPAFAQLGGHALQTLFDDCRNLPGGGIYTLISFHGLFSFKTITASAALRKNAYTGVSS